MKYRTVEEIEDAVDEWHRLNDPSLPLHEYLGMSWEEYKYRLSARNYGLVPENKCDILCANCHRIKSSDQWGSFRLEATERL